VLKGWQVNQMKTILVVDDDHGVRSLLRRALERQGHRVVDAESALDALDVLKHEPVDLALCDVMMPGRDGIWLTDQILSRYPDVPVALATGLLEMDPAITLRPGVVGYIVKPFSLAAVAALVVDAFEPRVQQRSADLDITSLAALDAF
jgi:DNA-binding NtrC family response regulator